MRGRGQKLDSHPLSLIAQISQIHDPAFHFFLRIRIRDHQQFAVVHFVLHHQQPAVHAHHQRFAYFAEFFAAVSSPVRLHLHFAKHSRAAPWRGKLNRCAHAAILAGPIRSVNCPCVQLFRRSNRAPGFACSLPSPGLTINNGGAEAPDFVSFFLRPQTFLI
jgi:hypothetical protein